jgi:hypothetical protein
MKAEQLPSVTPTSRTFTPGIIPQTVFEAQNGATSFVRFGNVPIQSRLQLVYQNIDEATAYKFAAKYNLCITTDQGIRINEKNKAVSDIKDPMLMGELVRGVDDGLMWLFERPPAIEAVLSGRYNVTIDLVGTFLA